MLVQPLPWREFLLKQKKHRGVDAPPDSVLQQPATDFLRFADLLSPQLLRDLMITADLFRYNSETKTASYTTFSFPGPCFILAPKLLLHSRSQAPASFSFPSSCFILVPKLLLGNAVGGRRWQRQLFIW
jgi:hypothetical protein